MHKIVELHQWRDHIQSAIKIYICKPWWSQFQYLTGVRHCTHGAQSERLQHKRGLGPSQTRPTNTRVRWYVPGLWLRWGAVSLRTRPKSRVSIISGISTRPNHVQVLFLVYRNDLLISQAAIACRRSYGFISTFFWPTTRLLVSIWFKRVVWMFIRHHKYFPF